MQSTPVNIFSSDIQQPPSNFQTITQQVKDFGVSLFKRLQQIVASLALTEETSEKISHNLQKAKEFLKQNKEVVLGVALISTLYIIKERRAQKLRNSKSRHIHSLTSNPNSGMKRSGSHKKEQTNGDSVLEGRQILLKQKQKKPSNLKVNYLRGFISQAQQEQEYIRSEEEDKDNPDLSASTRRTDSILSDIETLKKKKRRNLQPILDQVEEEEQTQDKVFFQMFRTYRES